jgi:hypothetical protein
MTGRVAPAKKCVAVASGKGIDAGGVWAPEKRFEVVEKVV